jgi:hypothetical protein
MAMSFVFIEFPFLQFVDHNLKGENHIRSQNQGFLVQSMVHPEEEAIASVLQGVT